MILLSDGKRVCEDCYDPDDKEITRGRVPLVRDVEGICRVCGVEHVRVACLSEPAAVVVYTWPEGKGESLGIGPPKRQLYIRERQAEIPAADTKAQKVAD